MGVSIKTDPTGIETGDIICSVWSFTDKKWVRILKDNEENNININKLEVERSLNGSNRWILCLYKLNAKDRNQKHVFYLDYNLKFKIWKKSAFNFD